MVMGRLRRMAGTRFHNEECPNEAHPSTSALMRRGKRRGFMGVERKSNRREFAPQKLSEKRLKNKMFEERLPAHHQPYGPRRKDETCNKK